ncbi:MAG: fused MFS/spermidine synthase [Candidatus Micrarchaeaceae archaeon]
MGIKDKVMQLLGYKIIASNHSYNHNIMIRENIITKEKEFLYNGNVYSRIKKGTVFTHSYWDYFLPLAYAFERPKVLIIGLGGGTIPYQFDHFLKGSVEIDVVELHEDVIEMARQFYPELSANIINKDGYDYVASVSSVYDIIILDAYEGSSIPSKFLTNEFIDLSYKAIKNSGVLAINAIGSAFDSQFIKFEQDLSEAFEMHTIYIPTVSNMILLCLKNLSKDTMLERIISRMPHSKESEFLIKSYKKSL